MRWCRFVSKDGPCFGLVESDRIAPVEGSPFTKYTRLRAEVPLQGTRLLAPVDNPTYYAIGRNYQGHMEGRARAGAVFPKEPWAWWRSASAISAHDDDIILPPDCPEDIEYECEPMVVIDATRSGRTAATYRTSSPPWLCPTMFTFSLPVRATMSSTCASSASPRASVLSNWGTEVAYTSAPPERSVDATPPK